MGNLTRLDIYFSNKQLYLQHLVFLVLYEWSK